MLRADEKNTIQFLINDKLLEVIGISESNFF